jgi:hypothetical protein
MFAALGAAGHDIEGFAEHDRTEQPSPFPLFHYLRIGERHRHRPFDAALYPLGRDASPYQGVFNAMRRLPGVVWLLDPVVHHLAVGGVALMEDWAGYREMLDEAYGASGAAIAQTVSCNWGTGALFRRYDMVEALVAGQGAVLTAWPALSRRVAGRLGREVTTVPLAMPASAPARELPGDGAPATREPSGAAATRELSGDTVSQAMQAGPARRILRVAIMTVNESFATSAVRAAAAIFGADDDASEVASSGATDGTVVRLCLSEPIYKAEGLSVAQHHGVEDRIDWRLTTSPRELAAVADDSDVLVWLAEELQGGHRMLLLRGMAAGALTVVPNTGLYDDLPEGAVAKIDLGRGVSDSLVAILRGLSKDADLRNALSQHGREFALRCAGAEEATNELAAALAALATPPTEAAISASAWSAIGQQLVDAALPAGADGVVETTIRERLIARSRELRE